MRIVLDTNVLVSGAFFGGIPGRILQAWRDGKVQIVVSPQILDEYREVLDELGASRPGIDVRRLLDLLFVHGELVLGSVLPERVCDDPDDDKFLVCAARAGADCVVSGDKHLLKASGYRGVPVLTPRAFVDAHLHE